MENKIELNENLEFVAPVNDINVLLIAPMASKAMMITREKLQVGVLVCSE